MTVLSTARLILTPPVETDFPDIMTLWTDLSVVRYIGGRPSSQEECWTRLLKYVGHWALFGFGYWMVREAGTDRFVGEAGFAYQRRTVMPDRSNDPEAGWAILPWAQHRGYASEALAAMLAWSDSQIRSDRTVCLIDIRNLPSIKLAIANGYSSFAATSLHGVALQVFERGSPGRAGEPGAPGRSLPAF